MFSCARTNPHLYGPTGLCVSFGLQFRLTESEESKPLLSAIATQTTCMNIGSRVCYGQNCSRHLETFAARDRRLYVY
jgi:hypothetical protein